MNQSKHVIVIPAKDESKTVEHVIESIRKVSSYDIILVDDASIDDTADLAKRMGCIVIQLSNNLGAWKATQTGIRYALKRGYTKVVTMDADGQHDPESISSLIAKSESGFDVVVGSCTSRGSTERKLAWYFFRLLSGLKIEDLTSGFRVYNRIAMVAVAGKSATLLEYQDIGVLFLIKHCGFKYTEVPVKMYRREDGISRIFSSWGNVAYYCYYSFILSAAKSFFVLKRNYKKKLIMEGKSD